MGTLTVQPSGKDTYIVQAAPNTNYGTLTLLRVTSYTSNYRTILEFPIVWGTDIPSGATVNSATLYLYYYAHGTLDPVGRTYWAYRLTRTNWVEDEATWNDYRSGVGWSAAGGDYTVTDGASTTVPADYGWITWNVLAQVQYAQTNTINAEFLVRDGAEDAADLIESAFYSNNYEVDTSLCPKLIIAYTPPVSPKGSVPIGTYQIY